MLITPSHSSALSSAPAALRLGTVLLVVLVAPAAASLRAAETCARVADHAGKPEEQVDAIDLGPVRVTAAASANGTVPLVFGDCAAGGGQDLLIPWSGADASPPARLSLATACGSAAPIQSWACTPPLE